MATFALASVSDLSDWMGEPVPEGADERRAQLVLKYASTLVCDYSGQDWMPHGCPGEVTGVVLQCAARGYLNPESWGNEGVDDWRGGGRPIEELGMYLTATEKSLLAKHRPKVVSGLGVVRMSRTPDPTPGAGTVPTPDGPPNQLVLTCAGP